MGQRVNGVKAMVTQNVTQNLVSLKTVKKEQKM